MAKKRLLAILLLSACDSQTSPPSTAKEEAARQVAALEASIAAGTAQDPSGLAGRANAALAGFLTDPGSARYFDVRSGSGNSICGQVESKQPDSASTGFRPFVVTPEGVGIISDTTQIGFGSPGDLFPDFYIRYCATPEELARLGPEIAKGESSEAAAAAAAEEMLALPTPAAAEAAAAAAAAAAALPGNDAAAAAAPKIEPEKPKEPARPKGPVPVANPNDEFYKAVIRPGSAEKK